ncbi:10724_t:CDS:2, partial [Racocetra fulgida]
MKKSLHLIGRKVNLHDQMYYMEVEDFDGDFDEVGDNGIKEIGDESIELPLILTGRSRRVGESST